MNEKIKGAVTLELLPIKVPSIVAKPLSSGCATIPVPLCDLDVETLDRLADDFRDRLFSAAGKQQSPICAPEPRRHDVKRMVDRFLWWKLPQDFAPDCGITFKLPDPVLNPNPSWPVGTNLLTADQAQQMIEHLLAD